MTERLLDSPLALVAAPMAGRITTVEFSKAVATAGAFPFLAGGYKTPEALAAEIEQLRLSVGSFGVNLFVPSGDEVDIASFAAYATEDSPLKHPTTGLLWTPHPSPMTTGGRRSWRY